MVAAALSEVPQPSSYNHKVEMAVPGVAEEVVVGRQHCVVDKTGLTACSSINQ